MGIWAFFPFVCNLVEGRGALFHSKKWKKSLFIQLTFFVFSYRCFPFLFKLFRLKFT